MISRNILLLLRVLPGSIAGLILALVFSSVLYAQASGPAADPALARQLKVAQHYETAGAYPDAIHAYKKANKMAAGKCAPCLEHLGNLYFWTNDDKQSLKASTQLDHIAATPADTASAAMLEGEALLREGTSRRKPELLKEADAQFRRVLAMQPKRCEALFLDGMALGRSGQEAAASDIFSRYIASDSADPVLRMRARRYMTHPELMREKMAPPFSLKTGDGQEVSLDSLQGKVVLLDFWATWCGPCNAELPHVRDIAARYHGKPLVVVSISIDRDRAKWQRFVEEHGMDWPQYWDEGGTMASKFGVNVIPHYFTIDTDGVLRSENMGGGSNIDGRLRKLVSAAQQIPGTAMAGVAKNR